MTGTCTLLRFAIPVLAMVLWSSTGHAASMEIKKDDGAVSVTRDGPARVKYI